MGQNILYSRENPVEAALRKQNEVLQEKLRLATETKLQLKGADVDKVTRKLLKDYRSKADFADISMRMKQLGAKISDIGLEQVRAETAPAKALQQLRQDALAIARDIVEESSEMVNRGEVEFFADIRRFLYRTKISLQNKDDIPDYDSFRRRNNRMGRFTLSDEGTPIDVIWLYLQDQFGEGLFPDSVANPADQLMFLDKLYGDMQPLWENPMKSELEENARACANNLLDALLSEKVHTVATTAAYKHLAQEYKNAQTQIENAAKQREEIRQYYRQLRERDRGDRNKRAQKEKIRRVVNRISQVLQNESTNTVNVKEDMRGVTQRAVYLAEVLFTDMRDDTILQQNIESLTDHEAQMLDIFRTTAEQRDRLLEEYRKLDLDGRRSEAGQELYRQLSDARVKAAALREQLKDVAERERNRLKTAGVVKRAIDEMQKAYEALKNSPQSVRSKSTVNNISENLPMNCRPPFASIIAQGRKMSSHREQSQKSFPHQCLPLGHVRKHGAEFRVRGQRDKAAIAFAAFRQPCAQRLVQWPRLNLRYHWQLTQLRVEYSAQAQRIFPLRLCRP